MSTVSPERVADRVPAQPVTVATPGRGRHRDPRLWIAVGWLAVVALVAAAADLLPGLADPLNVDVSAIAQGMSARHWLGTDELGRDILARVVYGARASLAVSVTSLLAGLVLGGGLGVLAGYFRGWLDTVVVFIADVLLAFPGLVFVLALMTFLGNGTDKVAIALSVLIVPGIIRLARASAMSVAHREFVVVARAMGATHVRVLLREVLPLSTLPVLSYSLILAGLLVMVEGALEFLGLGVPPPTPTWGGMIATGMQYLDSAPLIAAAPSVALFLTVLALNTIGDVLRSRYDVREAVL